MPNPTMTDDPNELRAEIERLNERLHSLAAQLVTEIDDRRRWREQIRKLKAKSRSQDV